MSSLAHADANCGICSKLQTGAPSALFENELWHVRAADEPLGVPGWLMLITRRHVQSPAQFDVREIESFGPTLAHLQRALLEVTGALRIYLAAMGESSPHFHAHLVPRYRDMPKDAKAWAVFDLQRAAAAGEIPVDAPKNASIARAYADALCTNPPPAPR
ncbi:MAG TPA: hypothetical protein VHV51_01965 [Polyangiaceae bacterium]|jgi:diadenosine tetraphosphate (Ap4A) HIT family hydrolase|nr:hypothetical protein [Polyangiaceae bacterium]